MKSLFLCLTLILSIQGPADHPKPSPDKRSPQNAQKPAKKTPPETPSIGVNVVNQQASPTEQDRTGNKPKGYSSRLFAPENLPNIILAVFAGTGVIVAVRTLKEMVRQRSVMQGQLVAMNGQIEQMKECGEQTKQMIEQATKQTTAIEGQVGLMKTAGEHTETLAAQAVKQSGLTQRQLDLTNRPWICIDSVTPASDLIFKESGEAIIYFAYQVRNVGLSVAQHLQPWIEPIIVGINDPAEVKSRISAQLKKPINSVFDHGKLIFPSQIIVDTYPVLIRKEVIEDAIKRSPFKGEGDRPTPCLALELFVCLDYQSTLDPTIHHQTQSMFILTRADPRGLSMGTFYPEHRIYKAQEISVGYKGYGAYAD